MLVTDKKIIECPREMARLLRDGAVLLHPTDTIPGLTCDPMHGGGMSDILRLKGRGGQNTMLALVASKEMSKRFWRPLPKIWEARLAMAWPEGLTIVWEASPKTPARLVSKDGLLALRLASHFWMRELIEEMDLPLPTTSVNRSGEPPSRSWQEAVAWCKAFAIHMPPDLGWELSGQASTLLSIHKDGSSEVLREGRLLKAEIEALYS